MDASHALHSASQLAQAAPSVIPAALAFGPIAAAAFVRPLGKRRPVLRDAWVIVATGLALLGAASLVPLVSEHHYLESSVPALLGTLTFRVDSFSMLFALFTTFVWFAATLHSLDYLKHEQKHDRYHTTSLIVLGADLGVVLAGDLVTLYLFFEALGLIAFLLVIHTETDEAKAAAVKYFWMTLVGGFALLAGVLLTFALGGNGALAPLPEGGTEALRWASASLLLVGFGVKAGMVPVHVWLPDAHPVAPAPASALLSGVMIKAGAYGIFRVVTALFRPQIGEQVAEAAWRFSEQLGLVVLWIGVATMFIGVFLALQQSNAKRMLAYHSVSQMGFILAGIGAAGYLGPHGAMGVAGGLYHVVNHALFKACLFLGVGAVYFRTRSLDMYHLGGLWKRMPVTFVFMCIAAAGITGVPLFNGFVSKCLIHHAIVEAWDHQGLLSLGIAEKIYIVTCGGTACSFIKLIGLMFLGKPKVEYGPEVTDAPPRMLTGMGLLAAAILVLGWFPQILIKGVFQPGLHAWGVHPEILDEYLEKMFLSGSDILSVVIAFALGFTFFFVGMRFGLFHLHAPIWLSIDYWYRRAAEGLVAFCIAIGRGYEAIQSTISHALRRARFSIRELVRRLSRQWRLIITTTLTGASATHDQHLMQQAYLILEHERQDTVRAAVSKALAKARHASQGEGGEPIDTEYIDAVREVAGYMARHMMNERMAILSDCMRKGYLDAAMAALIASRHKLASARELIIDTALELAPRRLRGESITRELSAAVNSVLSSERFDRLVAPRPVAPPVVIEGEAAVEGAGFARAPRTAPAVSAVTARGLTALEHFATWATDLVRLAITRFTQERMQWAGLQVEEQEVVETRLRIQRYARDISTNVAIVFVVLLLFVAALAL